VRIDTFPHAAAKRTSFDALAVDYVATVLVEFDAKEKATRERQLNLRLAAVGLGNALRSKGPMRL
jgi:hypothetical protein